MTTLLFFASASFAETLQNLALKIENEWNTLSIKHSPKIGPTLNVGAMGSISGSVGYHYVVTPAYMNEQHQRIDGYSLRLGANLGAELGVGRSAEAQISFSRLFSKKRNALLAKPRAPQRFPFNSSTALQFLSVGSAARFEVASDGHIGAHFLRTLNLGLEAIPAQFSASIQRGKRYIIDVYRLDSERVRLRLLATRNMGTFGTKASLTPLTSINFGMGFVDHVLNNLLRCDLITVEKTKSLSEKLPVDTMMVDYVINLKMAPGQQTYDQFFNEILNMSIVEPLSLFESPMDFSSSLWSYAFVLDSAFQQEKMTSAAGPRAIERQFKGRTLTDFRAINVGTGCFQLWDVNKEVYHGTSSVRSFDQNDQPQDYFYLGTQNLSERNFLFKIFDEEHSLGFNTLFHAQRQEEDNPLSLKPTGLSDLVLVRSFKDKKFFGKDRPFFKNEIALFKKDISYQYPQLFSNIDWRNFVNTKNVAYSRLELIFDARTVTLIRSLKYSEEELKQLLTRYIQGYIKQIGVSALSSSGVGKHEDPKDKLLRFKKDIAHIARRLSLIFESTTNVEAAVKSFSSLRKNPLFQDVGAGFILTLLPRAEIPLVVEATLSVGAENTPTIEVSSKTAGMTHLYKNVEHILEVINDRSFDLRLQKEVGVIEL